MGKSQGIGQNQGASELDNLLDTTMEKLGKQNSYMGRVVVVAEYSGNLALFGGKKALEHILPHPETLITAPLSLLSKTFSAAKEKPLAATSIIFATLMPSTVKGTPSSSVEWSCTFPGLSWHSSCIMDETHFIAANKPTLVDVYNTACDGLEPGYCTTYIHADAPSLQADGLGPLTNAVIGIDYVVNGRCVGHGPFLNLTQSGENICESNLPASGLSPSTSPSSSTLPSSSLPPTPSTSPSTQGSTSMPPTSSIPSTARGSSDSPTASTPNPPTPSQPRGQTNAPPTVSFGSVGSFTTRPSSFPTPPSPSQPATGGTSREQSPEITESSERSPVSTSQQSSSTTLRQIPYVDEIVIGVETTLYTPEGIAYATYFIEETSNGGQNLIITLNGQYLPEDGEEMTLFTYTSQVGSFDQIIVEGQSLCYEFTESTQTTTGSLNAYTGIFTSDTCHGGGASGLFGKALAVVSSWV